jgi:hypothetical protein
MHSYKALTNSKRFAFNTFSKRLTNTESRKNFASMAKFNYQDALNLEGLLTEEEKMVFNNFLL